MLAPMVVDAFEGEYMGLHEDLRAMVARLGPGVLDDADRFRAALDDFVPEDSATPGELNQLVDAVRLGALEMLVRNLRYGAAAGPAVESAGEYLGRERGSTQPRGARWTVAALGYALGLVEEAEVARHAPTAESPDAAPVTAAAVPPPVPGSAAATGSRRPLLVASAALAVLLGVGLVAWSPWSTEADPDDPGRASDGSSESPSFSPSATPSETDEPDASQQNLPPTVDLKEQTIDEETPVSVPVLVSDPNGDEVTVQTVTGLPPGLRFDAASLSVIGAVAHTFANGTVKDDDLASETRKVVITARDAQGKEARTTIRWTVLDSHRLMPDYTDKYGDGSQGLPDISDITTVDTPAHFCRDADREESTIAGQSLAPGAVLRYGEVVTFVYVSTEPGHPSC
ncbi:hypothetical protein NSZ01_12080 [Nocardioides szechwanensis]|uniref:Uncharacterized protein n=1 Tax=Nocardioides szechwanensis TaxID=1005944 RepID=A0A1H0CFT5_9ACTN|nr:putative Ig domain-containing protein [Nocardioides szechwanensis]GEP33440.1 hypothetical protein NSZ01_12080 [Nocardioides szechwanensis]SDN56739.1 hypothetical protein SAMN05192576_2413 [Nocardioides szechwanensis]